MKRAFQAMVIIVGTALSIPTMADTPATLRGPHKHGEEITGKISLFRAQTKGIEIGIGDEKMDAEVLVVLDSAPDLVLGIPYHETEPSSEAMIATLREAYFRNAPVTIQHVLAPGKKHLRINWVQLGK